MRNGQLKPAYNVQLAVNSEYITGVDVFSNRTDFGTLVPFLRQLKSKHKKKYAEVTADAGYESQENYLYLGKTDSSASSSCLTTKQRKPEAFKTRLAKSQVNITTERGIYLRMCRSIQVEGAFALLKTVLDDFSPEERQM